MVSWAASGKFPNTAFLCICVDQAAVATAKEFGQLYFPTAPDSLVNGFIDSQSDFPDFQAQLGCQGFIIFNSAQQIVTTKTLPFNEWRDGAFRDVEAKLVKLLQPTAPQNPLNAPVGQHVRIVNLTSEGGKALNGQLGEVVGSLENGRFLVKLGDASKAMKPDSLEDATDAPIAKKLQVVGLTSEKGQMLNGQVGEVLGGTASGRYIVRLSDATMSLKVENLQEPEALDFDVIKHLDSVVSVGHGDMDDQHDVCINAIKELSRCLSVKQLQQTRCELKNHFDDEEKLLRQLGFGGGGKEGSDAFSALGSHCKDHERIIGLADEALSTLKNVCDASDAYGGTVPKAVAVDLCKAFVDHAQMYDSLYEGKLDGPTPCSPSKDEVDEMYSVD